MKVLIVIIFTLLAFNVLASEEGENQKSDCPFANQSNKREAKVVLPAETEIKKEESKNISK